jgi:hypothetical protein
MSHWEQFAFIFVFTFHIRDILFNMRIKLLTGLLWISTAVMAQQDTTDLMDYSQFGDAEGVKRFCNQKVLNQTPTRIVSLGYEYQGGFAMPSIPVSAMLPAMRALPPSALGSGAALPGGK